ncbi:MAG TPA: damage-control phosphatase ARMT1 family protein [Yinghuangia sp.]|nr:damage-control phosphatase ARMT1 family protein [Yinghuangia sp.]
MTQAQPSAADNSSRPAPIVCSEPGSFAWGVFHDRHPRLLRQLCEAFPYDTGQRRALDDLLDETLNGTIKPLDATAHDAARWEEWGQRWYGTPWRDAPFLWAESYFYRRLLEAVGYFAAGPWQGIDPFAVAKNTDLTGTAVDEELAGLDSVAELTDEQRRHALISSSLWGNRADLGFQITANDAVVEHAESALVADDSGAFWNHLTEDPTGRVCLIADNAGRELLPDLVLIDHLLHAGYANSVVLHVKPHPYYVSDATPSDTLACLRRLTAAGGEAQRIGRRLRQAMQSGRLSMRTHPFACAPLPYAEMPDDLRADLATARLTILKGDLNYRRLVGDLHWPANTPFSDTVAHFPGPVAALRTLKSDVVVGLSRTTLDGLAATDAKWRTSGTHALIQVCA